MQSNNCKSCNNYANGKKGYCKRCNSIYNKIPKTNSICKSQDCNNIANGYKGHCKECNLIYSLKKIQVNPHMKNQRQLQVKQINTIRLLQPAPLPLGFNVFYGPY